VVVFYTILVVELNGEEFGSLETVFYEIFYEIENVETGLFFHVIGKYGDKLRNGIDS
jgi:hypothetical protein